MTTQVTDGMERHGNIQVIVADGWAHVVWRPTGHELGGPVESRLDVQRMVVLGQNLFPMLADDGPRENQQVLSECGGRTG